jgi:predicted RNase H-like HicB family nuclease
MKRYLIVIERTSSGHSAYSPDLPGCVATGASRREVEERIRAAIALHLEALREDGLTVPEPEAEYAFVEVA